MKNKEEYNLSERRKTKNSNELATNLNPKIKMPRKSNLSYNKTFIEKEHLKKQNEINFENNKIRNTMKELEIKGSIHCYSGSVETAREFTKLGYLIGIGGCPFIASFFLIILFLIKLFIILLSFKLFPKFI